MLQRALESLEVLPPHYRQELVAELAIRDEELTAGATSAAR